MMNLKKIFSGRIKTENFYSTAEFRRIVSRTHKEMNEETGELEDVQSKMVRTIASGTGKITVTLAPMKSLSLEEFTFPFQNTTKIREALRLQALPFSAAGELEIFPTVTAKSGRSSEGIVWYVSPEELDIPSPIYDAGGANRIWPAPLPFVSQLEEYNGNGVTMWVDEENICSILWQGNKPVMYRWKKYSGNGSELREVSWYDSYCKAKEIERGGTFTVRASEGNDAGEEFGEIVSESVNICSWIADVNLSRSALEGARDLERTVRLLSRASCWLLGLGIAALAAGLLRWNSLQRNIQEVRERSENFYRQTFDPSRTGRISNPVNLARDRIASITGTGHDAHPLDETLADMGEVFREINSSDVTIDIVRFNAEGIDCTGTAPDMTTVLNFRRAWERKAQLAQVDNTQFVSGIGYRFDLRVRW